MNSSPYLRCLLVPAILGASALAAAPTLHPLFSDGAVLQQGEPLPVWGTADPGETVTVTFGDASATAVAGEDGRWSTRLPVFAASAEPRELRATSPTGEAVARDVVVGEVWLASGQSNMDSPMRSGSAALALPGAADPLLRVFRVRKGVAVEPQSTVEGRWLASDPDAARDVSAVAWFFARELRASRGVPVGILHTAWGGTPIRTWMGLAHLRAEPPIARTVAEWDQALARHLEVRDRPELMTAYYAEQEDWDRNVNPAWREARRARDAENAERRAAGLPALPSPQPERPEPAVPDPMAHPAPSKRPQTPSITYNAMIAPLAPYALRGFLWYQGEADGSRATEYRAWLPRMIEGWRGDWGGVPRPFLIVQLPGHGRDPEPVATTGWAFVREAQALAARALPAVGYTVTIDLGDAADVHPDNKEHVGRRLAAVARETVYGETVAGVAPAPVGHEVESGAVRVRFAPVRGALRLAEPPWRAEDAAGPVPLDRPLGFFVAGADRRWHPAEVRLDGDAVVVSSPAVAEPVAVRYAWANTPALNLYDDAGVPVAPFRTDDWPR